MNKRNLIIASIAVVILSGIFYIIYGTGGNIIGSWNKSSDLRSCDMVPGDEPLTMVLNMSFNEDGNGIETYTPSIGGEPVIRTFEYTYEQNILTIVFYDGQDLTLKCSINDDTMTLTNKESGDEMVFTRE